MKEYITKYKCRYCGKIFNGGITGKEEIAVRSLLEISVGKKPFCLQVNENELHLEPDHYSIGDFIGIEIVGGEE